VGSSAGALTGLQFVVIALIAQSGGTTSKREIRAFGTPTVIHFCAALVISVVMNIPWLGGLASGCLPWRTRHRWLNLFAHRNRSCEEIDLPTGH
jgi:hypothetical protein